MIVLDTNVLSALMRLGPDQGLLAWLDWQPAESVWSTAVAVLQVRTGIDLLPVGGLRRRLEEEFRRVLTQDLRGRVLTFVRAAAEVAGALAAKRRREGIDIDIRDTQIAGIVLARRAAGHAEQS